MQKIRNITENRKPRSQWKDRYVYTMAGLFGGLLGIHDFYLGFRRTACLQIVLSIVWILLISFELTLIAGVVFLVEFCWIQLELLRRRYEPDGDLMNDEARPLRYLLIAIFWLSSVILPLLFVVIVKV